MLKKLTEFFGKIYISYIVIWILIVVMLFTLGGVTDWFRNKKISYDGKIELLELLEIKDAPSFQFVHIKLFYDDKPIRCLELKFKISKEDYEKNGLEYGESFEEVLLDCNYIEKEKNGMYTCVVRRTNTNNYEFYKKLNDIK